MVASPALVVGMQDNEYTDAQVGDAGGLFKSLGPALCGAVPVFLIQCSGSSLHHPVLQIQSTSSSAAVPVYLIQCSGSIQCCSSKSTYTSFMISALVPSYLIQCSSLQFQSTSSSLQFLFNFSCSLLLFLYIFFLSNFTFFLGIIIFFTITLFFLM